MDLSVLMENVSMMHSNVMESRIVRTEAMKRDAERYKEILAAMNK